MVRRRPAVRAAAALTDTRFSVMSTPPDERHVVNRTKVSFDWRDVLWQAVAFGFAACLAWLLLQQTSRNLHARGIASGYAFLESVARVPVANAPIGFEPGTSTYARALFIGVLNTLKVSGVAIMLATILGLLIGVGRLSRNYLVSRLCGAYVELIRNVPVLLHIFLWYQLILNLPGANEASATTGFVVSNKGIFLPWLAFAGHWPVLDVPKVDGFDISGGAYISPEFAALLIGLVTYTASFIAEIARSGVLAVSRGQWEAGQSVGLPRRVILRRIILPQALRISIPPVTSEYLGILKNSSLAVAIGYQDVVAIGNSILFETGQAIEVVSLTMAFYVVVSLLVSWLMNALHRNSALAER
jgi:general L-amino acid transport system permease protein